MGVRPSTGGALVTPIRSCRYMYREDRRVPYTQSMVGQLCSKGAAIQRHRMGMGRQRTGGRQQNRAPQWPAPKRSTNRERRAGLLGLRWVRTLGSIASAPR